jgi:protein-tyrosine phosphatase
MCLHAAERRDGFEHHEGAPRVSRQMTGLHVTLRNHDLERARAEALGLTYRWLPVPDQGTCSLSEAVDLVRWCRDGLERGESVVVTCMGGLGRSGMITACTLVDLGLSPADAIASVRAARGPRALETSGQEALVSRFAAG